MDDVSDVGKGGMKKNTKQWRWWLFAIFAFLIFIILQIPATWLIAKFSKDINYYIMLVATSGRDKRTGNVGSYEALCIGRHDL